MFGYFENDYLSGERALGFGYVEDNVRSPERF